MNGNYLLLGGLVGAIAMAWSYVRGFLSSVAHIAIESTTLDPDLSDAVEAYLVEHARAVVPAFTYKLIFAWHDGGKGHYRPTINKYVGARAMFLWGTQPIWLSGQPGKRTVATIRGLGGRHADDRGRSTLDYLTTIAMKEVAEMNMSNNYEYDRTGIRTVRGSSGMYDRDRGGGRPPELAERSQLSGPSTDGPSSLGQYMISYFPYGARHVSHRRDEISRNMSREALVRGFAMTPPMRKAADDIYHWKLSEDWYRARGIPWRRGWLLIGGPGTGKTSFVRHVASSINMPILSFDLASMNNTEFGTLWADAKASAPCIALFEDIDCVYHGRELVDGKKGPSFDMFLNTIGGVESVHGVCVVVTTNRPELLDPALCKQGDGGAASRPGRIDRVLTLDGAATLEQRRQIAANILDKEPALQEEFVRRFSYDTPAQFVSRCQDAALDRYWAQAVPRPLQLSNVPPVSFQYQGA